MVLYPVAKRVFFPLCTKKFDLVSESVTRRNLWFVIDEILNFRRVVFIQVFRLLNNQLAKILLFSCSFCNLFTLEISGKNVGQPTVSQRSSIPGNSVQVDTTPKRLLCGFVLFWNTKRVSRNTSINENFYNVSICQLNIEYNARNTASKVDKLENGRQKEFRVNVQE